MRVDTDPEEEEPLELTVGIIEKALAQDTHFGLSPLRPQNRVLVDEPGPAEALRTIREKDYSAYFQDQQLFAFVSQRISGCKIFRIPTCGTLGMVPPASLEEQV